MKKVIFLSFLLQFFFQTSLAQVFTTSIPTTTNSISITPQMSASSVSAFYSALATASPQQPGSGPDPGDASSSNSVDSDAGASGHDGSSMSISKAGIVAIIVCAVGICVIGAVSAVLFYLAKKRNWQVREKMRRSARRVATALTPRRTTFDKDALKIPRNKRSTRGLSKIEEVPPTPKLSADIEKGNSKMASFEMTEPPKKESRWARKIGR